MSVSSDHATIHLFKIDLSNADAIGNAQDDQGVLEEEAKEDQKGFFAKLFNKQGMGDRAYAKW